MDELKIVFGVISSIGVIVGIYFHFRNRNGKDNINQVKIDNNNIGNQTIQQANKIVNNNIIEENRIKTSTKNKLDFKSDKDIRDYIYKEMENMSLVDASFNKLAKKFIDLSIDWVVTVEKIEKDSSGDCEVFFDSSKFHSRLESFIVNPIDFPIVNFAKKNSKYRIEAKIKELDEITLVLNRVTNLERV